MAEAPMSAGALRSPRFVLQFDSREAMCKMKKGHDASRAALGGFMARAWMAALAG